MVVEFLTGEEEMRAFAELLRPEPTADGFESEERLVICGVSWERYLALDKALGDDRPGPRFYFLDGELEIMTTSNEHERIKKWIGDLMAVYFEEASIEIMPRGQATMRKALKQAGAEPAASGPRHRAARALRGDPFMAAGPSRVSRRLRRQPLIRDAAGWRPRGVAVIRALLLRAFSFHRLMIGYSNLAKVQKGQLLFDQ